MLKIIGGIAQSDPRDIPGKRMSMRIPSFIGIATVVFCALIWLCRGMYVYWDDPKIVNFLAAWIPLVLSILVAFVPEHQMTVKKKIMWRGSVILVGFIWSVVLWHQQDITDRIARADQERMVTNAVIR